MTQGLPTNFTLCVSVQAIKISVRLRIKFY